MSEALVRWTQNVAGRHAGYEETIEVTDFIRGLAENNRLVIVAEVEAEPNPYTELAEQLATEVAKPRPRRGSFVNEAPEVAFGLAPAEEAPAAE